MPFDFTPDNVRGGRLSLETYQVRAKTIRERPEFRQLISRVLTDRYADKEPSIYVEGQIYEGFTSPADEARLHDFHRHDWPRRTDMIESLEDDRLRELGERLVAIERTDLLTDQKCQYWKTWRRDRLLTQADVPWLTIHGAREEIAQLREDALPRQHQQLDEIELFVMHRH